MYSKEELEASGLLDFRRFLFEVWAFLQLPRPTPLQLNIARWIQNAPDRAILQGFRGVAKSYITVAFVLWTLLLDPDKKILVVSANESLASDFTKLCFQLIHGMPILRHLAPSRGQLQSTEKFDVGPAKPSKNPSVKSVGITGQLTGSRADLIVPDDCEVPKNSVTPLMRERLFQLVKEFAAILTPGGRILYLGTPQTEETLYRKLESHGYVTVVFPAEVPKKPSAYRGNLAPYIQRMIDEGVLAGTPTEPSRFDELELFKRRLEYGPSDYARQFMLDTTPSDEDAHPLKLRDLIIWECAPNMAPVEFAWGGADPLVLRDLAPGGFDGDYYHRPAYTSTEMAKYTGTVMAIDPSGMGKDETAYAIIKYLHGNLYLVDLGGFVDGFGEETLQTIAGAALRWGVNDIIIEKNYGGGMFNKLLQPYLIRAFGKEHDGKLGSAGRIDDEWNGWSSTQKELRIINTLLSVVQNHRLIVDRGVIERDLKQQQEKSTYSFVQQYTRIKRDKDSLKHEDRLEAVSMACAYFTDRMDRDQKRSLEQHKEKERDALRKQFIKHVFGIKAPERRNWLRGRRRA